MSDVLSDAHMYLSEPDETVLTAALRNKDDIPILMDIVGEDSESPISQEMHFKNSMFRDRMGQVSEPELEIESIGPASDQNTVLTPFPVVDGMHSEHQEVSSEANSTLDRQAEREQRAQTMPQKSAHIAEARSNQLAEDVPNKQAASSMRASSSPVSTPSAQPAARVPRPHTNPHPQGHSETKPVVRKYVQAETPAVDAKRNAPGSLHKGDAARQTKINQSGRPERSADAVVSHHSPSVAPELLASAIQAVLARKLPELITEVMTEISKREKH